VVEFSRMKKNLFTLLFAMVLIGAMPFSASAILNQSQAGVQPQTEKVVLGAQSVTRKLSFRAKRLVPFAQRQVNAKQAFSNGALQNEKAMASDGTGKSQIVAFLLCLLLGLIGIHRFYLGYTGMGILYLLTLGLFGIGWLIDLILLIIPNGLTPKNETRY
jgi:TM2 domain